MFKRFLKSALIVPVLLAAQVITQSALARPQTVVYVDANSSNTTAPSISNPGDSWSTNVPFKYLQDGLTRAGQLSPSPTNPIEIHVRGTSGGLVYKPDQGDGLTAGTRSLSFVLRVNVFVIGQYVGTGSNPDTVDLSLVSILDGDLDGDNDYSDNSYHVVRAGNSSMTDTNTLCQGFVIRNGNGNGDDAFDHNGGGGVYVDGTAAPRFDRCTITANRAGIGLTPEELEQALIPYGAGVDSLNASPVFTRCTISSNQNNASTSIYAGGVCAQNGGQVRLIDCKITGNQASRSGGGIAVKTGSDLLVLNCLVTGNIVSGDGLTSPNGGGISIDRSATATITNATVSDNTALNGGGIAQFGGDSANATVLQNSIVWANHLTSGTTGGYEIYFASSSGGMTISYSDIRDRNGSGVVGSPTYGSGVIGENTTTDDPNFANAGAGNYHLNCTSPAIDTGNPTVTGIIPADDADASTTEATPDLDLVDRVRGTSNLVDMGCYEKPGPCCTGDANGDNQVNVDDMLAVLTHWNCSGACVGDVYPSRCLSGTVQVDDLLTVLMNWNHSCPECGTVGDPPTEFVIDSYADCQTACDGLTGDAWLNCMRGCFELLCKEGHTEFCGD